ncbi:hypothetical protein CVT25_010126 [Psilocybe cyanescens]|uniref:Carbohydrate-binding module family 19 domain-containing protein n=1 Tax=Psilocybe cyanescens TaxID=93625 RepID=A0A409XJ29_PSICY|nr:hypothetical protein CVT25_010126 [Psilocybe cyanescens]
MVQLSAVAFLGLVAASASASPLLVKRIAQNIADSTAKWEQACLAAGGSQRCNPLSVTAFSTLLAAAGPCEQQDAADNLLSLGKELNSNLMVTLAQIFAQQPRNSPNSVAIPYCQTAPKNAELAGLFQCQFAGSNQKLFVGNVAVGGAGTIPLGLSAPLNPAGSCPANPAGPIADGTQLVDLTTNPRAGGSAPPPAATTIVAPPAKTTAAPAKTTVATPPASTPATGGGDFKLANGKAAQALNAKFLSLTADSPCTAGENACIGSSFAQCVGGKFVAQSCGAAPLTCAALPLVNAPGTSITCTTLADAAARIAATGATGGVTGSDDGENDNTLASAPATTKAAPAPAATTPATTPSTGGFRLANGQDAQALNAKFATLSANSACTAGENACIKGSFAQCVNGKFAVTGCAGGLTCVALPLVNSRGTSITCDTTDDALARIQAAGATGGITGA